MKIDLTKEEWEFLFHQFTRIISCYGDNSFEFKREQYNYARKLIKKLGSEWVDDEYCLKCKNEHVACVCMVNDEN